MTARTTVSVLVLGLAMAACASPTTPTTTPAPVAGTTAGAPASAPPPPAPSAAPSAPGGDGGMATSPCVLTVDEVGAALAVTVTSADQTGEGDGSACTYVTGDGQSALNTVLMIGQFATDLVQSNYFEAAGFEEVSGIGDRAGWFEPNSIFILVKGDRVLTMSPGSVVSDAGDARAALETLARLAAEKL